MGCAQLDYAAHQDIGIAVLNSSMQSTAGISVTRLVNKSSSMSCVHVKQKRAGDFRNGHSFYKVITS